MHLPSSEWQEQCDYCQFYISKLYLEEHRAFCTTRTKKYWKAVGNGEKKLQTVLWDWWQWKLEEYRASANDAAE